VVQVNGKVRAKLEVAADISESGLKELILADPAIGAWLQNKPPKKFIYVPGKLVNLVV